jgi:hypothetical protein
LIGPGTIVDFGVSKLSVDNVLALSLGSLHGPEKLFGIEMSVGSTLIILGAGCSFNSGYPLAKDMRSQLQQFSEEIRNRAPRLAALVQQTVDMFKQLDACGIRAETIDELAWHVHQGKLHDRARPEERRESYRVVEDAKVSVAALFLSKEPEAIRSGLPGYRRLMQQLFSGTQYSDLLT